MLRFFLFKIELKIGCSLLTFIQGLLCMCCVHVLVYILGCATQELINLRHNVVVDRIHGNKVEADT
ncbi:hypothetical protein D3C75_726120 [compost metagenome]